MMQNPEVKMLLAVIVAGIFCEVADARHRLDHDWKYVKHRNWNLLPHDECGLPEIQRGHKIMGGPEASIGQFPWMVGLLDPLKTVDKARIICGGSLINDRYVVSAAHCLVQGRTPVKHVILGEHNQTTDIDCDDLRCADPALRVEIEVTIRHPGYKSIKPSDTDITVNDIALIRLRERIAFNEFVWPICLPTFKCLRERSFDGWKLETSGWGRTEPKVAGPTSDVLRWVHAEISNDKCKSWNPCMKRQICAVADEGADSCQGDSGGPLMASEFSGTRESCVTVLAGVNSFRRPKIRGDKAACGGAAGVYTRVTFYTTWILSNIRK